MPKLTHLICGGGQVFLRREQAASMDEGEEAERCNMRPGADTDSWQALAAAVPHLTHLTLHGSTPPRFLTFFVAHLPSLTHRDVQCGEHNHQYPPCECQLCSVSPVQTLLKCLSQLFKLECVTSSFPGYETGMKGSRKYRRTLSLPVLIILRCLCAL